VSDPWQPSDEVVRAARRLAGAAMASTARRNRLAVLLQLAEDLLRVTADDLPAARKGALRVWLAAELGRLHRGTASQQVAVLRMVARLTLDECAELIGKPRDQIAPLWRATRARIFRGVRQRMKSRGYRPSI